MKRPDNEKKFYENNVGKVFYYVPVGKHRYLEGVKEVTPSMVDGELWWKLKNEIGSIWVSYDCIFKNEKDAEQFVKNINSVRESFRHDPFVSNDMLIEHFKDFKEIEDKIEYGLKEYRNFDGIDFCDVSAHGIQVRIHHKDIKGYTYGNQFTIEYDFSNKDEIPDLVVNHFKEIDNADRIKREKEFISWGEKYGWD